MFTLVGCRECSSLWIVKDRPERTTCPRCDTSHAFNRLKSLARHEQREPVAAARSKLLAKREGIADFEVPMEWESAGIDIDSVMESAGLDVEAIAEAGKMDDRPSPSTPKEFVLETIEHAEEATTAAILAAASDAGRDPERIEQVLEKLHRNGDVRLEQGQYVRV